MGDHYEALRTTTGEWVVLNTRADMTVVGRLTNWQAFAIAKNLNRAEANEPAASVPPVKETK